MIHQPRIHFELAPPDTSYLRHMPCGMTPAEAACLDLLDRIEELQDRVWALEKAITINPVRWQHVPRLHLR